MGCRREIELMLPTSEAGSRMAPATHPQMEALQRPQTWLGRQERHSLWWEFLQGFRFHRLRVLAPCRQVYQIPVNVPVRLSCFSASFLLIVPISPDQLRFLLKPGIAAKGHSNKVEGGQRSASPRDWWAFHPFLGPGNPQRNDIVRIVEPKQHALASLVPLIPESHSAGSSCRLCAKTHSCPRESARPIEHLVGLFNYRLRPDKLREDARQFTVQLPQLASGDSFCSEHIVSSYLGAAGVTQ